MSDTRVIIETSVKPVVSDRLERFVSLSQLQDFIDFLLDKTDRNWSHLVHVPGGISSVVRNDGS